ncbi:RNA polymerase sigma factor [Flagellimonas flava]|uniref:RNA polymerase sigma-70 factor, ECF subfamily n=1 Tax=Flagellimonas flava TaxID=570519 RepID=A0A1M5NNA6_9FLAO|nr:RNA polymerase sigma-70 factor [Allomuricauda flava]SHG91051.1 RNA polymerase sigma-70 factor, ECF subfamily [Allomuricauda flava]
MDSNSILREIQKRNQFVFKKFFEDTYEELVHYANSYLFDPGYSEDMVQEVFIYLWERAGELEIKSSLRGYLYSMVRNKCLNYLKSIKITDTANVMDLQSLIASDYNLQIFSDDDLKIVHQQLLKVVENLPSKMKQIVKMRFIDNYKYIDIAEELGVSVNTVKTQLKRAKLKISQQMALILTLLFTQ